MVRHALLLVVATLPAAATRAAAPFLAGRREFFADKIEAPGNVKLQTDVIAAAKKPVSWKQQMLFRERLMAGSAARGVAQTVLHPIDVARTRLQAKGVTMAFSPGIFLKGCLEAFLMSV